MINRNLTPVELELANKLLDEVRQKIDALSAGDSELAFAYRRKIYKELSYDGRGKPAHRKRLKELKRFQQKNICPICSEELPLNYAVLDRLQASDGYTEANTRLIHTSCDTIIQESRGYA